MWQLFLTQFAVFKEQVGIISLCIFLREPSVKHEMISSPPPPPLPPPFHVLHLNLHLEVLLNFCVLYCLRCHFLK